jgi:hypothetical protein
MYVFTFEASEILNYVVDKKLFRSLYAKHKF